MTVMWRSHGGYRTVTWRIRGNYVTAIGVTRRLFVGYRLHESYMMVMRRLRGGHEAVT